MGGAGGGRGDASEPDEDTSSPRNQQTSSMPATMSPRPSSRPQCSFLWLHTHRGSHMQGQWGNKGMLLFSTASNVHARHHESQAQQATPVQLPLAAHIQERSRSRGWDSTQRKEAEWAFVLRFNHCACRP